MANQPAMVYSSAKSSVRWKKIKNQKNYCQKGPGEVKIKLSWMRFTGRF